MNNKYYSPCMMCNIHGSQYSEENCSECEYNVAIKTLKAILINNGACKYCLTGYDPKYSFGCATGHRCGNHKNFILDWDKVFKEYQIKI